MLHRTEIKVGVPYKGSGVLNEYGQWMFTPAQVGSREGQKKLVVQEKNYTIYTTNKKVIVHLSIDRDDKFGILGVFLKMVDKLLINFKEYDFRRILPDKSKRKKDK